MINRPPPATKALLIATLVIFGLQYLLGDVRVASFMLWPPAGEIAPWSFQPWQLLTYGFLHGGFFHLFFNILALFMFGAVLEQVWGKKRFTWFYLLCIVGAGVCQLAVGWWMTSNGEPAYPTLGASGGVLGLVLAFGMVFPNQKIMIFPIPFFIPAKVAVLLIGGFALFAGFTGSMPGIAHFAHLGGMLTAWLLIRYWRGQPPFGRRKKRHLRSI